MKKIKTSFCMLVIMAAISIIAACSKTKKDEKPAVTVVSPILHAEYQSGDTFNITVTASHSDALHEFKIELTANDTVIWIKYPYVHNLTNFTFDTTIIAPAVSAEKEFHIKAKAEDHNGNLGLAEGHYHINP